MPFEQIMVMNRLVRNQPALSWAVTRRMKRTQLNINTVSKKKLPNSSQDSQYTWSSEIILGHSMTAVFTPFRCFSASLHAQYVCQFILPPNTTTKTCGETSHALSSSNSYSYRPSFRNPCLWNDIFLSKSAHSQTRGTSEAKGDCCPHVALPPLTALPLPLPYSKA